MTKKREGALCYNVLGLAPAWLRKPYLLAS